MQAFYADQFVLKLPEGHRFPMAKYRMLRDALVHQCPEIRMQQAPKALPGELALAHHPAYIRGIQDGTVDPLILREIGFPWSEAMAERAMRSVGASVAAARVARQEGLSGNLAGGTHHASAERGGGFCVFNDMAVTARVLQTEAWRDERRMLRVAMIDLDVHQGNGTASIFARDDSVFTLSMHGAKNFPFRKVRGDLDVDLPDGCTDVAYMEALHQALTEMAARFEPDFVIYQAGADAHEGDRLGRLKLSHDGMVERDRIVMDWAWQRRCPMIVCMGGGYGHDISATVAVHVGTWQVALEYWRRWQGWHNRGS